ncbi:MAG: YmdB family metallophosphoesterase [Desulfonatronovibrionaceae bacterium]
MKTRLLFLGDIVGKAGRRAVLNRMAGLRLELGAHFVLANAENTSGGLGLTPKNACELLNAGIDLLTSGNHIWKHREIEPFLDKNKNRVLRPANYPGTPPGTGLARINDPGGQDLYVLNLMGRTYMEPVDCPFREADRALESVPESSPVVVDFHAEATSEKMAMAHYLLGRVTAVIGTHTHVLTNDARVLGKKTGCLTDAGMCGALDSVLGVNPREVLHRFLTARPARFKPASGPAQLNGAVVDFDARNGLCLSISAWKENELEDEDD